MNHAALTAGFARGVRIAGTGSAVPDGILTNDDLARMVDTSDEWIQQRTGIKERRICDKPREGTLTLSRLAVQRALEDAGLDGSSLDLVIVASVTGEMACPSLACRIAGEIGATPAGAFDVVAACSGFVYAMNLADSLIRVGRANRIAIVGCDCMSSIIDYDDRSVSILFGDAAGSAILEADDDPTKGSIYQTMEADGSGWQALYIPRRENEIAPGDEENPIRLGCLRMNGREVYKFAVTRFQRAIKDGLEKSGLAPDEVGAYICHQSNARIIESAVEKLGLPSEKVFVNIDKFGNSSAGSVGLCLDQMRKSGRIDESKPTMLVAFGGGMTWASSVWRH
ncbi:MAG: ketoacyl-ACP synthase III [Phycisphaera sp. TMED9]|nr:MAG: ketoacyl-ACP synthase III [Phycisphaera sp. TMED9]